ncbi:MAG: hypothetical protein FJY77_00270 [Candidatus Altiarchaeales archaeon]|nr:hypothetical protein [Candidatus Altiarchaeales archaeon]
MERRRAGRPLFEVYKIPDLQGNLFMKPNEEVVEKIQKLGREKRYSILMEALKEKPGYQQRVVKILEYVKDDDRAFAVALDTLAYSRRRDRDQRTYRGFKSTLECMEECIKTYSELPLGRMEALLEVGMVFNMFMHPPNPRSQFRMSDESFAEFIQKERNWVNGGEKCLDGNRIDIRMPPISQLVDELHRMYVSSINVNGVDTPIENAPINRLQGVYVGRMRNLRKMQRMDERFLTTNDW